MKMKMTCGLEMGDMGRQSGEDGPLCWVLVSVSRRDVGDISHLLFLEMKQDGLDLKLN